MSNSTWRDVKWWVATAITIVLGLASLAYPVFVRELKELTIVFVSNVSIVSPSMPNLSNIVVMINDRKLPQAYLHVISVRNSGTEPIVSRDFEAPLTVEYQIGAVLAARVAHAKPRDLAPQIQVSDSGDKIVIGPLLLNPGDAFTLEVLSTRAEVKTVRARVAGIKALGITHEMDRRGPGSLRDLLVGLFVFGVGTIFYFVRFPYVLRAQTAAARTAELVVVGLLCCGVGLTQFNRGFDRYFAAAVHLNKITITVLILIYAAIVLGIFRMTRPRIS